MDPNSAASGATPGPLSFGDEEMLTDNLACSAPSAFFFRPARPSRSVPALAVVKRGAARSRHQTHASAHTRSVCPTFQPCVRTPDMTNLPDNVLDILCRDILPSIRKTGGYSFEAHLDRLDAEFLAAEDKSEEGAPFQRYVRERKAIHTAWNWIVNQSAA